MCCRSISLPFEFFESFSGHADFHSVVFSTSWSDFDQKSHVTCKSLESHRTLHPYSALDPFFCSFSSSTRHVLPFVFMNLHILSVLLGPWKIRLESGTSALWTQSSVVRSKAGHRHHKMFSDYSPMSDSTNSAWVHHGSKPTRMNHCSLHLHQYIPPVYFLF